MFVKYLQKRIKEHLRYSMKYSNLSNIFSFLTQISLFIANLVGFIYLEQENQFIVIATTLTATFLVTIKDVYKFETNASKHRDSYLDFKNILIDYETFIILNELITTKTKALSYLQGCIKQSIEKAPNIKGLNGYHLNVTDIENLYGENIQIIDLKEDK